ncbi:MAG: isoprenyl transferase [Rhodothermales bacterium]|nr:isoprenyl transferase [Rhodothermales bacterium]
MSSTADQREQDLLKKRGKIPVHIAIIMDGNGRWAKSKGKTRVMGHREGVESVRDITEACAQLGVEHLTLYTFSTENWMRPVTEVDALMELLVRTIRKETKTLKKNGISLKALGDLSMLPAEVRNELDESIKATPKDGRMTLNMALSYSGRWDITNAVKQIARLVADGSIDEHDIDEDLVEVHLSTAGMPAPDLLIRTGGEVRVSNYLLWQLAYSELYFTPDFWPEFRRQQLYAAIKNFQDRERRFGRVLEGAITE